MTVKSFSFSKDLKTKLNSIRLTMKKWLKNCSESNPRLVSLLQHHQGKKNRGCTLVQFKAPKNSSKFLKLKPYDLNYCFRGDEEDFDERWGDIYEDAPARSVTIILKRVKPNLI